MRYVMTLKDTFKLSLLPKNNLYLRPYPSVCVWSRARILNLFAFPWNLIQKPLTKSVQTRRGYCENYYSLQQYFRAQKKKLYMSFSIFLTDLCEIMSLEESSALKAVVYLKGDKKIYQHFVNFTSGSEKKLYALHVHKHG